MRNLNACQAEVFRRSEKRIKERKQRRNHIAMACIPLVLCISLSFAFILPTMMTAGSRNPEATEAVVGSLTGDRYQSLSSPIAKITVSGLDFSETYTNASDILPISARLYSYGTRGPEYGISTNGAAVDENEAHKENANGILGNIADSANTGFTITLVTHEGGKTEYYLAGNTLKNLTTNQTYTLPPQQLNELKELLGIPNQ